MSNPQHLIHTIQQAFSGVTLGRTIRQIYNATNEIKAEIEQSMHQATDIDIKFIADTSKKNRQTQKRFNKMKPLLSAILLLCCSCKYFLSSPVQGEAVKTADVVYTEKKDSVEDTHSQGKKIGNPIDYDKDLTIKEVYVTTRDSIDFYEEADDKSARLGKLPYAEKVEVVQELNSWYGIKQRIQRKYKRNDKKIIFWQWEKLFIKKEQTGDISQIKLNYKDLITTEDKKPLKKINIRFVTKDEYLAQKANAVDFDFINTTNTIKKVKGKLRLPCQECKNKYITYIDSLAPKYDDNRIEHTYIGEIPFLNQYLISTTYYEGWDYTLIDKTTGKKFTLADYPYITPDRQYFMTLLDNVYEGVTEFSLYSIDETNKIKQVFSTTFTQWALVLDEKDREQVFMGSDGSLYAKVINVSVRWDQKGHYNPRGQYICISIK